MISTLVFILVDSANTCTNNSEYSLFFHVFVGDSQDDCVLALKADDVGADSGFWYITQLLKNRPDFLIGPDN
jgi:hypothetical protein